MGVKGLTIGKMRTPVKFERSEPNDTDSGGQTDHFIEFLSTRGYLKKNKGDRGLEAGAVLLRSDYSLVVRSQQALVEELEDSATCRIVADNRVFTIDSYENDEQDKVRYIMLQLSESHI